MFHHQLSERKEMKREEKSSFVMILKYFELNQYLRYLLISNSSISNFNDKLNILNKTKQIQFFNLFFWLLDK